MHQPMSDVIFDLTQQCFQSMFDKYLAHGLNIHEAQVRALFQTAYIISSERELAYKLMLEFATSRSAHTKAVRAGIRQSYMEYRKSVVDGCRHVAKSRSKTIDMLATFINTLPLYI